jgi:hypothetical protein
LQKAVKAGTTVVEHVVRAFCLDLHCKPLSCLLLLSRASLNSHAAMVYHRWYIDVAASVAEIFRFLRLALI